MEKKSQRPKLPADVRLERRQFARDLFRQGKTIREVNRAVREKYERPLNWKDYRKMEAEAQGKPLPPEAASKQKRTPEVAYAVQPVRSVSARLRDQLQAAVTEMRKSHIDRVVLESSGEFRVVFCPEEQLLDLREGNY